MKSAIRTRAFRFGEIGLITGALLSFTFALSGQEGQMPLNPNLASKIDKLFTSAIRSETSGDAFDTRVRQVFVEYGIPTNELVGEECAEEWVVLVSGQPLTFVEAVLPALKRAADTEKVSENSYIYLLVQARQKRIRERFSGGPANPGLKKEIDHLFKTDQAVRPAGVKHWDLKQLAATDRADGITAHAIFTKYGLPTFALVGPEASQEFDDVVQHQPLAFQKQVLPQMEADAKADQVNSESYAMLLDRVESSSHQPQTYGENFVCTPDGKSQPSPMTGPANVDRRRAEIGLMPLGLYSKVLAELYMNNLCAQVAAANKKAARGKPATPHL